MEIEAKFQILSTNQVATLKSARHLMNYPLDVGSDVETRDFYFDSAAFHLLRRGLSLRLRKKADGWVSTIKGLQNSGKAGIHARLEIEEALETTFDYTPAERLDVRELPRLIQDGVATALGDGHKLRLLCQIDQVRHKRMLFGKEENAQPLAEVSIDDVRVHLIKDDASEEDSVIDQKIVTHFYELEVEMLDGTNEAWLKELSAHLRKMPGLKANKQSKYERALRATYSPRQDSIDSTMPTAEFCRMIWLEQLFEIVRQEEGVRMNNADAVHDMRVAIRRMRGAARLFGKHFHYDKIAPFLKHLRHTARILGHVRDLDVAHERLQPSINSAESNDQVELAVLGERWRKQRAEHHDGVREWIDSRKYSKLITRLFKFCSTAGAGSQDLPNPGEPPLPPYQVRHVLPSLLLEHYASVRAFESVLLEQDKPVPIETLHALRIECKYLRYALEFALPLLGEGGETQIDHQKRLQTLLGDLNDAAVSAQILDQLPLKDELLAVGQYHAQQQQIMENCRQQALRELQTFLGAEPRRQFLRTIARI